MNPQPKPLRRPKSQCPKCRKQLTARAMLRHHGCGARNRFGNVAKKTKFAEYTFDSRLERDLYVFLKHLASETVGLVCVKPDVYLTDARILCVPDFVIFNPLPTEPIAEYHEAKGLETAVWRIKRRLWMHYGPGPLVVWKRASGGRIEVSETLVPKGSDA